MGRAVTRHHAYPRAYKNLRYLLLKAQRMAVLKTEFVFFRRAA